MIDYCDGCNGAVICTKLPGISSQYRPYFSTFGREMLSFLLKSYPSPAYCFKSSRTGERFKAACNDGTDARKKKRSC